ncbi:CIC11C00000003046 [Sungouiella intermedia]|uniref:CIC11C00000003046 n=1 Tax=Sungouiella intermedia TaxID=45354 RepID=A0A1L0DGA7_9ASCO|nr:CIC11C00000003046 [[Candida] intermedia]
MGHRIVVLSGGTATNDLVPLFNSISTDVTYVLPILDNGGSTSEIIRVIGGPAIGDIRSRLTRLIPDNKAKLRDLLSFRLDQDPVRAKAQWNELVDGTHPLWNGIPLSTKEIFRAFLIHVHVELLKRSKISMSSTINKQFRYELANVGNLFLTGVRLFIGSLDSAIELFMKMTDINPKIEVLPCINTNFSYHIGAKLSNDLIITGQSQISHPSSVKEIYPPPIDKTRPSTPTEELEVRLNLNQKSSDSDESALSSDEEAGNLPLYIHPELKKSQLHFNKTEDIEPLLSPIERVFYISPYGEEICPTAQNHVISAIANAHLVIFSIGSLMTSIVPIVILKGVGRAIASDMKTNKKRILFLNGCEDRETFGMQAYDYVRMIVELAKYSLEKSNHEFIDDWTKFVTHLFYMDNPRIPLDVDKLQAKGIQCIAIRRDAFLIDRYDLSDLQEKLQQIHEAND